MPSRPLGKCSQPGCPNRTTSAGRCVDCSRKADRDLKLRQTWRPYDDPRWPVLRDQVLLEEPQCSEPGCPRRSTVADHVIPVRQRPDLAFTRSNVQGLCAPHHNAKTAAENNFGGAHH